MVSVLNFKRFMGYKVDPQDAKKSVGVLTITKNPPGSNIISIPKDTVFSTPTKTFQSIEDANISESNTFIPLAVQSVLSGASENIPAGQLWSSGIAGITIENSQPFSGGEDAVIESSSWKVFGDVRDESELQKSLDAAIIGVKTKLSLPDLIDNVAVDRAVYLLATFYFQNNTIQEKSVSVQGDDLSIETNHYYRERIFQAIQVEIDSLIAPYRNVLDFMPAVSQ